jgi:hypothetical protein
MTFEEFAATVEEWRRGMTPAHADTAIECLWGLVVISDLPRRTARARALAMASRSLSA